MEHTHHRRDLLKLSTLFLQEQVLGLLLNEVGNMSDLLAQEGSDRLEEMLVAVDQMADRIESLESILDADHPNWRQERGGQNKKEV